MRMLSLTVVTALLAGTTTLPQTAVANTCRLFVLKRVDRDFAVETINLAENETKVLPVSAGTGIIDIILPVGPGVSGSMAKWSDDTLLIARCVSGELQVTTRVANEEDWKRPARKLDDLARYDVRVSVTAADGAKRSFLILQHTQVVREEVGPVVDVFGGMIPMNEGDYTLCTDTYQHKLGSHVEGEAPLEYDHWPLVVAKLPDGTKGVFIVDIGAGTTVVIKEFLPTGTKIKKASMVQYSSGAKKMLKYAPGGATGTVDTILGHATLPELRLGSIRFENPRVDVIREIPDFFGRRIAGILGLDLMRRCNVLSMSFVGEGGSTPTLRMGRSATPSGSNVLELPFTFVSSHLTVDGKINGSLVHFIMDTGAPDIILDAQAARRIGVGIEKKKMRPGRGLDGGEANFKQGQAVDLSIAGRSFGPVQPRISALSCFVILRTNKQNAGLLGNSFFSKFKRIELDFDRRVARFVE